MCPGNRAGGGCSSARLARSGARHRVTRASGHRVLIPPPTAPAGSRSYGGPHGRCGPGPHARYGRRGPPAVRRPRARTGVPGRRRRRRAESWWFRAPESGLPVAVGCRGPPRPGPQVPPGTVVPPVRVRRRDGASGARAGPGSTGPPAGRGGRGRSGVPGRRRTADAADSPRPFPSCRRSSAISRQPSVAGHGRRISIQVRPRTGPDPGPRTGPRTGPDPEPSTDRGGRYGSQAPASRPRTANGISRP